MVGLDHLHAAYSIELTDARQVLTVLHGVFPRGVARSLGRGRGLLRRDLGRRRAVPAESDETHGQERQDQDCDADVALVGEDQTSFPLGPAVGCAGASAEVSHHLDEASGVWVHPHVEEFFVRQAGRRDRRISVHWETPTRFYRILAEKSTFVAILGPVWYCIGILDPYFMQNSNDRLMAALGYVGALCLIPLIFARHSAFAQVHAKQGLVLSLIAIVVKVLASGLWRVPFGGLLVTVVLLAILIAAIMGIVKALQGEHFEIPYVSDWARKIHF